MTNREEIMTQFAKIRLQIEEGDRSSHPRDWFESVLDMYEEEIKDLKGEIDNLEWLMGMQDVGIGE